MHWRWGETLSPRERNSSVSSAGDFTASTLPGNRFQLTTVVITTWFARRHPWLLTHVAALLGSRRRDDDRRRPPGRPPFAAATLHRAGRSGDGPRPADPVHVARPPPRSGRSAVRPRHRRRRLPLVVGRRSCPTRHLGGSRHRAPGVHRRAPRVRRRRGV